MIFKIDFINRLIIMKNFFTLCPTSIGQISTGVAKTPSIIKNKLKIKNNFKKLNLHNTYHNDDILLKNKERLSKTFDNAKTIYYNNSEILNKNLLNINIGGDHSISLGSVASSIDKYKDDLFVIWIDAHTDINSFDSSKSKNTHGMPLYYLTSSESYINESWLHDNQLDFNNLMYIGIRDIDLFELDYINKNNIHNIDMNNYSNTIDFQDQFNFIKKHIGSKKIHLSIDVDALDPSIISCTGTPVPKGIDLNYLIDLIKYFKNDIVNVDLVELNLELRPISDQQKSLENFLKIVNSF